MNINMSERLLPQISFMSCVRYHGGELAFLFFDIRRPDGVVIPCHTAKYEGDWAVFVDKKHASDVYDWLVKAEEDSISKRMSFKTSLTLTINLLSLAKSLLKRDSRELEMVTKLSATLKSFSEMLSKSVLLEKPFPEKVEVEESAFVLGCDLISIGHGYFKKNVKLAGGMIGVLGETREGAQVYTFEGKTLITLTDFCKWSGVCKKWMVRFMFEEELAYTDLMTGMGEIKFSPDVQERVKAFILEKHGEVEKREDGYLYCDKPLLFARYLIHCDDFEDIPVHYDLDELEKYFRYGSRFTAFSQGILSDEDSI